MIELSEIGDDSYEVSSMDASVEDVRLYFGGAGLHKNRPACVFELLNEGASVIRFVTDDELFIKNVLRCIEQQDWSRLRYNCWTRAQQRMTAYDLQKLLSLVFARGRSAADILQKTA